MLHCARLPCCLLPPLHPGKYPHPSYEPLHIVDNERRCKYPSIVSNALHLLKPSVHPSSHPSSSLLLLYHPPLPFPIPFPSLSPTSSLILQGTLTKIQQHSRRTYLCKCPIRFFLRFLSSRGSVSTFVEWCGVLVWKFGRRGEGSTLISALLCAGAAGGEGVSEVA